MLADSPYLPSKHTNLSPMKRSRNKRQTETPLKKKSTPNYNSSRTNSLIEKSNISPIIIPKMIRTVSCYLTASTITPPPPLDLDSEAEPNWSRQTHKYEQKIRVAHSPEDDLYLNKAIDFLTAIETQSSEGAIERWSSEDSTPESESLPWVAESGAVKQSFRSCLTFSDWNQFPTIDLSDMPLVIPNSLIKDNLNEEFKEKHPFLNHKLTLSKIVNLREDLISKMCRNIDIEACTLAIAWIYFIRLLSKNVITKANRKLYGAVCVLLAYKFNEESHLDNNKDQINTIIKFVGSMDKHGLLQHKHISMIEFEVYAHLNFSLLLKYEEIKGEFLYTLCRMGITFEDYVGGFYDDLA